MQLMYKEDWEQARNRMDAWWLGEVIDRVAVRVTAPKEDRHSCLSTLPTSVSDRNV